MPSESSSGSFIWKVPDRQEHRIQCSINQETDVGKRFSAPVLVCKLTVFTVFPRSNHASFNQMSFWSTGQFLSLNKNNLNVLPGVISNTESTSLPEITMYCDMRAKKPHHFQKIITPDPYSCIHLHIQIHRIHHCAEWEYTVEKRDGSNSHPPARMIAITSHITYTTRS